MSTTIRHDVFLSHNSADKTAVEKLARRLVEVGIRPWLDKWNLVPGEPWQEALEEALDACQAVAVFLGPSGIGPWQNEEMRSALEERVRDKSRRVIPVLLPGSSMPEREELPRFLKRLTWVDFRGGLDDADAFHRLVSGIKGVAPGPPAGAAQPIQLDTVLPARPEEEIIVRLGHFNLNDEIDPAFGDNDLTRDLLQLRRRGDKPANFDEIQRATSSTIFLAVPCASVAADGLTIIKTARELFQPNSWYDAHRPGPRGYAREVFPLHKHKPRTTQSEFIVEQIANWRDEKLRYDTLRVNQLGEVAYATSYYAFDELSDGRRIFRLGEIIHRLWSFLCLVWEFYESIGYAGNACVCVAMVNTKDSFLGHFANGCPDPYQSKYRSPLFGQAEDEICRDPNLLVREEVDFTKFQPKTEPEVIYRIAEKIALAYNQQEARCFEPGTRRLMEYDLHRRG
jgi:hypothetical protein